MKIGEAAKYLGYRVQTLQKWDREGKLKPASRTKTNRREYTKAQLDLFLGRKIQSDRKIYAYCRVSSPSQKSDLLNQRKLLELYCANKGYTNVEFIDEIGGGLNFNRKKLQQIFSEVQKGQVSNIIVTHKDRLCRFGFDFLNFVCVENSCLLEVINAETTSPEQEVTEDLMAIIHCFSCRLYGLRKYNKQIKKMVEENDSCS